MIESNTGQHEAAALFGGMASLVCLVASQMLRLVDAAFGRSALHDPPWCHLLCIPRGCVPCADMASPIRRVAGPMPRPVDAAFSAEPRYTILRRYTSIPLKAQQG